MAITVCLTLMLLALTEATLDVRVSGQEIQRLLFGTTDDIKIVKKGTVSSLLRNNLTDFLPPILPRFHKLELEFQSRVRLYYDIELSTSDPHIMRTPSVTIPYSGRLDTNWISFVIRFPCTGYATGVTTLGFIINFYYDEERTRFYKRINLSMKRECKKAVVTTLSPANGCAKRCDLNNFSRMYCLSDFVARVKIIEANLDIPDKHYIAHMSVRKIFRHPATVKSIQRKQRIESYGNSLTCNCQPLERGKKYLLFGREDSINQKLFLNRYSLAFEIPKSDGDALEKLKEFRRTYRTFSCPSFPWKLT